MPVTAHILGGAVPAADASRGVIDMDHRVFGYENLLVCDGSAIPANPGVNPSLTITAMTERVMDGCRRPLKPAPGPPARRDPRAAVCGRSAGAPPFRVGDPADQLREPRAVASEHGPVALPPHEQHGAGDVRDGEGVRPPRSSRSTIESWWWTRLRDKWDR